MNSAQQTFDMGDSDRRAVHGMLDYLVRVSPVLDPSVRGLCCRPYPLHPKGCPNFGQRATCPPQAPLFVSVYDAARPVWAVVNEFDLGGHVERMRAAHPNWSDRQLRCCLYWQRGARKQLQRKVMAACCTLDEGTYGVEFCPEAMGVNVTATLAAEGITLEWPPVRIARQVALIAYPNAGNQGLAPRVENHE
jgi:predicted metal-binding protein